MYTLEEIKALTDVEVIETRLSEINIEKDNEHSDIDALTEETRALVEQRETLVKAREERKKDMKNILDGAGETIKHFEKEDRKMTDIKELRNSAGYMDKLAEAIKTGEFKEVREALLTTNVNNGTIEVPDFVYDIIKTAWDRNEIMSLVSKVSIKGNLKVNFEISGDDAVMHTEGSGEVQEEELLEGIITLVPVYFKKWKSFSDEVMSMRGEAFIRYIYDEITYRIFKKSADQLIALIAGLPQVPAADRVAAAKITAAPAVGTVATAMGELSDEAVNPVVVMNKRTWSKFKTAQYEGNYPVDPFEGLAVHFNNSLPAYDSATEGDVYMIVGDFAEGALANFPNGETIEFTFDELSRKKEDLVEVLGKIYGAVAPVAVNAFTLVAKPAQG